MIDRNIELFKEDGIFIIRHHFLSGRTFDQEYKDEAIFLGAVATLMYTSLPGDHLINVEKEIAPIVMSFLGSLVA